MFCCCICSIDDDYHLLLFIDVFIFSEAFNQAEIQFLVILLDDYVLIASPVS